MLVFLHNHGNANYNDECTEFKKIKKTNGGAFNLFEISSSCTHLVIIGVHRPPREEWALLHLSGGNWVSGNGTKKKQVTL